jgi:hypothetical protein
VARTALKWRAERHFNRSPSQLRKIGAKEGALLSSLSVHCLLAMHRATLFPASSRGFMSRSSTPRAGHAANR